MESNKLEVKLSSGISFNFNNLDKEDSKSRTIEVKQKPPSTLRRNAARKKKFMDKKKTASTTKEVFESSNNCDQCDHEANCKVSLRKHIGQAIPQIDGFDGLKLSEDKSSQTNDAKVKHSEAQTETSDSPVTVKWGGSDQLVLAPGTVILRHMPGSGLSSYVPSTSLGMYHEEDKEHILYRFQEDKVHLHTGGRKF